MNTYKNLKFNQKGAVLMVGMLIIIVLTIIGVSAISGSVVSEKITLNQRNKEISFQAAESALVDGEQSIAALINIPSAVSSCENPPCDIWELNNFSDFQSKSSSWWKTNARPFSSTLDAVNAQPYFIIEEFSFVPYDLNPDSRSKGLGYYYFRVTAKGSGSSDEAQSIVQSIYATQFN